jgi:hypothetical protein
LAVTTYALWGEAPAVLMTMWPAGIAYRCARICRLPAGVPDDTAAQLCEALTRLSTAVWDFFPNLDPGQIGYRFAAVHLAVLTPNVPDADGTVLIAQDPLLESGHTVGRILHSIADDGVTAAVAAEVRTEIDAVEHAGLGDRGGRAAQALSVDHLDPSPAQVAAADHLLSTRPLGNPKLFAVDPPAACVAAAHWLTAAADVTAEAAGIDPVTVFTWADDLEGAAVEVPATIVKAVLEEGMPPRHVVVGMLTDALAVGEGRQPDPEGLPALVDAAREQAQQLPVADPDAAVAGMLESLTPLNPCRPSRDLLEQLLDGVYSCLIVYRDTAGHRRAPRLTIDEFVTRVRARATRDHDRLTL